MSRRKQKGKRSTAPRDPEKLCIWVGTDGKRCNAYRQKGQPFCAFHPPEKAAELGKRGGAVTSARWAEIEAAVERLPLLTAENQAKYLNALIEGEDKGPRDLHLIAKLMDRLEKVTRGADDDREMIFVFTDPEIPEGPMDDLPPLPVCSCPHCGETVSIEDTGTPGHQDADPTS